MIEHRWHPFPIDTVSADESVDGIGRTIRKCAMCDLLKVTAHAGNKAWREYAYRDGTRVKTMPECKRAGDDIAQEQRGLVPVAGKAG